MRGQVLGVDRQSGEGQISGDDGRRYTFRPEDWSDPLGPAIGALIDFDTDGRGARRIYRQPGTASVMASPSPLPRHGRNKIVAALLALFLGMLGIHRFYLGRTGSGVTMLLLTMTVIGTAITAIWSLIDAVRLLVMPEGEFVERYDLIGG